MHTLYVNNTCINYTQISNKLLQDYTGNAQVYGALKFLKQWYSKKNNFTFFTSGSTGKPKKIIVTRNQLIAGATATNRFLKLSKTDVFLVCLNTEFVAGRMMLLRAVLLDADIILVQPTANPLLQPFMVEPTFAAFVPMQVQEIISNKQSVFTFKKLAKVIIGGAQLLPKTIRTLQQFKNVKCWQTYGMTETLSHVALMDLRHAKTFKLLPGISVKTDSRGCIAIKGIITQHKWVQTNDIVRMYGKRCFKWLGRADFVINSGGVKIFIETLESVLAKHLPRLNGRNFFVTGLPDEKLGEKVVLIIESNHSFNVSFNGLSNYLHKYKIPKVLYFLPQFVYTETGKINRKETLKLL
jgi:O-succinylbenzoic acid--CoA ligase